MIAEEIQRPLLTLVLVFSGAAALLGVILLQLLFKPEAKKLFSGTMRFVFTALAIGYVLFGLGELSNYLIFDVFKQLPSVSMPDFYWVLGQILVLCGFITFSVYLHKQYGNWTKFFALIFLALILITGIWYFLFSLDLSLLGGGNAKIFLGYFYPLTSSFILVASINIFLFFNRIDYFRTSLTLFLLANVALLSADLLFAYYMIKGGYGWVGVFSDSFYILTYLLCSLSFLSLILNIKNSLGSVSVKSGRE